MTSKTSSNCSSSPKGKHRLSTRVRVGRATSCHGDNSGHTSMNRSSHYAAAVLRRLNRWESAWTLHDNPLHQMSTPAKTDDAENLNFQSQTRNDILTSSSSGNPSCRHYHSSTVASSSWNHNHYHQQPQLQQPKPKPSQPTHGGRVSGTVRTESTLSSPTSSSSCLLSAAATSIPQDDSYPLYRILPQPRSSVSQTTLSAEVSSVCVVVGTHHHQLDRSSSIDTSSAAASLPDSEDETAAGLELESVTDGLQRQNEIEEMTSTNDVHDSGTGEVVVGDRTKSRDEGTARFMSRSTLKVNCDSAASSTHDQSSPDSSDSGIQTDCNRMLIELQRLADQRSPVNASISDITSINNNVYDNDADCNANINYNNNNNKAVANNNHLGSRDMHKSWFKQSHQMSPPFGVTSSKPSEELVNERSSVCNENFPNSADQCGNEQTQVLAGSPYQRCLQSTDPGLPSQWSDGKQHMLPYPTDVAPSRSRLQAFDHGPSGRRSRYAVRSLGWVPIDELDLTAERCWPSVNRSVNELSLGRRNFNDVVGRWGDGKSLLLEFDNENMYLTEPTSLNVLNVQSISSVRMWGVGRQNGRDFAYVARDDVTRRYVCHVFRCDGAARPISDKLHQLCGRHALTVTSSPSDQEVAMAMYATTPLNDNARSRTNGRQKPAKQKGATRPRSLPNLMTSSDDNKKLKASEATTVMKCRYIGMTNVYRNNAGVYLLDEAMQRLYAQVPRRQWTWVKVIVTQSTVTVLENVKTKHVVVECCIHFLSHVGVASFDVRLFAFVLKCADGQCNCHVFYCEPSAVPVCSDVITTCKLYSQRQIKQRQRLGQSTEDTLHIV